MGVSQPSLFTRMRRFAATPGRDASEDRLTEGLAATLQAAPGAAAALVNRTFGPGTASTDAGPVWVDTQAQASGLERADLELVFAGAPDGPLRVWFEVKDRSPAGRGQGERYMTYLQQRTPDPWRFAWLTRAGAPVEGGLPESARHVTWQAVAEALVAWAQAESDQHSYGVGLVYEYVKHLEELRMARTTPLSVEDAQALNQHETAQAAARHIMGRAQALIVEGWGPSGRSARPRDPLTFWMHFETQRAGQPPSGWPPGTCWFEWKGDRDRTRAPAMQTGAVVIGAGVTFVAEHAPSTDSAWIQRLLADDFEYGRDGKHSYLMRYWTVHDLAAIQTLDGQSRWLADRVLDTFGLLSKSPPPGSASCPSA